MSSYNHSNRSIIERLSQWSERHAENTIVNVLKDFNVGKNYHVNVAKNNVNVPSNIYKVKFEVKRRLTSIERQVQINFNFPPLLFTFFCS